MKRKCYGDDSSLLPWSNPKSKNAKRQKHGIGPKDIAARSIGEDSSGSQITRPLSHQPAPYINRFTESNVPYSRHTRKKLPATGGKLPVQCSSVCTDKVDPFETTKTSQKRCEETMNITDRKQHFLYTPDEGIKDKMKKYVNDVHRLFDYSRSEDNCWLHPSPPLRRNGHPAGRIQCDFKWKDSSGIHALHVNFGIVALIINLHLTEKQIEGYVNKAWHLSHLCGNWTCCNWRHMTVESAGINIGRNGCFPVTTPCSHDPPCMKDKKRRLLVTLDISNQIKGALKCARNGAKPTLGCQINYATDYGSDCGICDSYYCNYKICRSLTSITKSQEALEKLELCSVPSEESLKAIAHLKWIIADLIREKEASDAVFLQRAVAQREKDQSARWSRKHIFSYGQKLAILLD